jgi:hypothetical protein
VETNDEWAPLSVREGRASPEDYEGPYDGVPPHLERAFGEFIGRMTSALRRRVDLRLRRKQGAPKTPDEYLDVTDTAIKLATGPEDFFGLNEPQPIDQLSQDLALGGSVYRVGRFGLERRIDEATLAMFDASLDIARKAQTPSGSAATHLIEAWTKTYGINPEPSVAALLAVKAVEDVAVPAIIPKDRHGTLGKVINALRAEGKWEFKPARDRSIVPVRELAQFIWAAPLDRHAGTTDYSQTTLEQAEAIVHASVVLVRWFAEGQITAAGTVAAGDGAPSEVHPPTV